MLLARHFAQRMAYELNRDEMPAFTEEAEKALLSHPWWGNIRELKNVVERAVYRSNTGEIDHIVFDPFLSPYELKSPPPTETEKSVPEPSSVPDFTALPLKSAKEALERHMLKSALEKTRYNQKKAAEYLGLTYDQFRGLRRKYKESPS